MLNTEFYNRDAIALAIALLGKVIRVKHPTCYLSARIIETEAYYQAEKASHASLGMTQKRQALFMSAGTIYMYYARGGDSLNISCRGDGDAVLIKSAAVYENGMHEQMIPVMQQLNPIGDRSRPVARLCSGQTLLCRSLGLKVPDWDQQQFCSTFYIEDVQDSPETYIQTTRLGIPEGRDGHLPYRFIDPRYVRVCTSNPLSKRMNQAGRDYHICMNAKV